jgi:hypothetical protein
LTVGFVSVALGGVVGVILGLINGYFGGIVDALIMRVMDVLRAFPGILLAVGGVALLGPGIDNVIYALAVFSVPVFAGLVRGSTLALKQTLYVQASRSIGLRAPLLILRHILQGTLPSVIVYCSLRVGASILTAAVLSLGFGEGWQPINADDRHAASSARHRCRHRWSRDPMQVPPKRSDSRSAIAMIYGLSRSTRTICARCFPGSHAPLCAACTCQATATPSARSALHRRTRDESNPARRRRLHVAAGHPGLNFAFGPGHFGMSGGPPSGRLLARLTAGQAPGIDPAPYGAHRFSR